MEVSAKFLTEKYWFFSTTMMVIIALNFRLVVGIQALIDPKMLLDFDYQRKITNIFVWMIFSVIPLFSNCLLLPLYEKILLR